MLSGVAQPHLMLALQGAASEDTGQVLMHRWQFGFNLIYHYLYPQLTMGLILLIVILETLYLRRGNETFKKAANFWTRIFAPAFVIGAVTGIPLEFGFGTNWALFSTFSGGVIGQTVAMEGTFAFFVESAFLGLYLFGGDTFGKRIRWFSAFMVFVGSWASGYFILAANSFMQHPVGYKVLPNGNLALESYWRLLFNPWLFHQFTHVMGGTVVVGSFAMAGVGAYYLLSDRDTEYGKMFVSMGVVIGLLASAWMLYPSGDMEAKAIAEHQPTKLAAAEGIFDTTRWAPETLIGQIDVQAQKIYNTIEIPGALSFLAFYHFDAVVKGLNAFPRNLWPDNIPLVYYSYRLMVGIDTIFVGVMGLAAFQLWRKKLFQSRRMLWVLLFLAPFPFIANTAGWVLTEVGRQPWVVWGLMRTANAASTTVSAGNVYFTILGLAGIFLVLSVLYVLLASKEIQAGPEPAPEEDEEDALGDLRR